jgi:phage terminase large subunit-like protein
MIAVFNTVVATLVSALGVLFWSRQTKTVKDSFNTLWYSDLPALKFHFVGICIEMGVVLIVAKPSMFISSLVKKYGKQ